KEVFLLADKTMLTVSKKDSQEQTVKFTAGSVSPKQMADENNHSVASGQYDINSSSHQECWRSDEWNRHACSDDDKEEKVGHLQKSQSLGNMLQEDCDHHGSEGTDCDITDHDYRSHCSGFKSNTDVEESTRLGSKNNQNVFDASSDLISHGVYEPSVDHAADSDRHHSYDHSKFPRSQSAIFQNNSDSDREGSVDSERLGPRCRSFEDLCSMDGEKVDYLSGDETNRSETLDLEDGSGGRSDAAEDGQRSSASIDGKFVRDGMLSHDYWDGKYIAADNSAHQVAACSADSGHYCVINGALNQEREEKLWNRNSGLDHESLGIDMPNLKNLSDLKDISEEAEHNETGMNGDQHFDEDPNELSPRAYSIKRIEDWISQIDIDSDIIVEEQGESSSSASTKYSDPVISVSAVRPDAKSPLGMEIAYTYISKLTPVSSSAQLPNLGLVAIPRLSAFSGLRLLNLSGNSIVRITAGALPKGLHMLSLSNNNISIIEGLRELTRLRLLDISYNRISRIGHGLASCSSLKELYLAGNKISEVDGLHRLLKLKVLDLRHNKISTSKGLGQLAANYNSLEAINLDGNPAQKNVGDQHLKKYLLGLLPNLAVYNKQPVRATGSKEVSDRHTRKISSSHRSDRSSRSDRKSSRLVAGTSSRHARPAHTSGPLVKQLRSRNMPMAALGSRPVEYAGAGVPAKQIQLEEKSQ
uniref:U2A'/phosphoprotein 32 family A C-terminal domain-containing protein n=1 Tax=Aegilops tauschii subsp. strangulata TaxID=200361 RepID=A0A453BQ70_AEGTS